MVDDQLPEPLQRFATDLHKDIGSMRTSAWTLLSQLTDRPEAAQPIAALKSRLALPPDDTSFESALLSEAARQSSPRVGLLAIDDGVRRLLERELQAMIALKKSAAVGSVDFRTLAKIATLRRFPAGPMDWEVDGLPRSTALSQLKAAHGPRFAWFLGTRLRAFKPLFFMHVAPAPRRRSLVIEKEVLRSWARMARSMEKQPEIRGIISVAWFLDPEAVKDNPHVEPLSRVFREGGLLVNIGPAPADAGFLEHNAARKAEFEAGRLQYQLGLGLWPREAAIRWARAHPELES